MPTIASPVAYAELDQIELLNAPETTLWDVRAALPHRSMLAAYLDDFLPGNQSQWLNAKLVREADGWLLNIKVDTLDATGGWRFTASGDFAR